MEEIDLKELYLFFKSKISILIIIVAATCLIGCFYGIFIQKPMYSSYTTVILSSNNSSTTTITQNDIAINKNLVTTYAEIVKSRKVLDQVIKELNLDSTYENLSNHISVTSLNETEIIKISVSSRKPKEAKKIADSVAKFFIKEVSSLYNLDNVSVLDKATTPTSPYNINVTKTIVIFFAIGLIIGSGILFLIFYFDRSVKSVEQIEEKIKLPILGTVQKYGKGGK